MATHHEDGLSRATPESAGVDPTGIDALLSDLDKSGVELHTLMLYRAGSVIAEGSWWPYRADRPHMLHSATKSFLAVAVGLAIEEGFFALDTKVVDIFPDRAGKDGEYATPNLAAMTVEDLLTQTSGHAHGVSGGAWRGIQSSWVDEFFRVPVVHKPGSTFVYSSATSFMLSAIVSRTTGTTVREFLEPRLFQPLGIKLLAWDVGPGPENICPGGNGISCLPSDFLKLGILHLQRGRWAGKQILPESWVAAATTPQRGNKYGYHWWAEEDTTQGRHCFWASGFFGQLCVVFPQHDAVLVTTGAVPQGAAPLMNVLWRHFPKLFAGSASKPLADVANYDSSKDCATAQDKLTARLHALRLPQLTLDDVSRQPSSQTNIDDLATVTSMISRISRERFTCVTPNEDAVYSLAFDFSSQNGNNGDQQSLTFHLQDQRGHHTVQLGLHGAHIEGTTTLTGANLHHGYEPPSLRVVATAAWTSADTLRMVMQFTETAFRDTFTMRFFGNGGAAAEGDHTFVQLDRSVNVNSFATRRPTVFGAILRSGKKELSSPELVAAMAAAREAIPYSTSGSTVGELLDNPQTRAVLEKEAPQLFVDGGGGDAHAHAHAHPHLDKARKYTLDLIMERAQLDVEDLARINAKLVALSAGGVDEAVVR